MTPASTLAQGDIAMVNNQHRAQNQHADRVFLDAAIGHLRHQVQRAVPAGWTAETTEDGRRLITGGSDMFREVLVETLGVWAEPVQAYLLTAQPRHMLHLLALLEVLAREIATGDASGPVRNATVDLAAALLGPDRAAPGARRRVR